MALGEIYIKVSVTFADDPKVRALARYGPDSGLARDLFIQMICHCKRLLTDGFVPDEQIGLLVYPLDPEHGKQLAKQLASVGLIKEEPGGWQVLAYLKRNGTREDVERLSKVRAEAGRKGGSVPLKRARQSPRQATSKQLASQNGSRSDPYTETETENTDASDEASGSTAAQAPPKRGTRLPDDFTVTAEMVAWAREYCPHVDGKRETEKFTDYWQAKAGRDATKLDWAKTWKNWMRTAEEQAPRRARASPPAPESTGAQRAQQALEAGRRVQAMLDGGNPP